MRVLVCSIPLLGHLNPLLPLSWALRAEGHDVLVATDEGFAPRVLERGLPVASLSPVPLREVMARDRAGRPVPHTDEADRVWRSGRGWGRLGARHLAETVTLMRRWRPDLLVTDPVEYAGPLAAARLGIPWIEHGWGIRPVPEFALAAEEELEPELTAYRLRGLPRPTRVLDTCSPSLQRPGASGEPMRYIPVTGPAELPAWLDEPGRRPLVCLTFGSVLPSLAPDRMRALMTRLMHTLPALDVDVVVAVDPAGAQGLRPVPPGVVSVGWQPLDHVVPRCAVLVHYGASGMTMAAMAAGVPQVVLTVPIADAPDNARRIEAAGLGIALPALDLDADQVVAACRALLTDPSWRSRAAQVAAEQADRPTPDRVAAGFTAAFG
ncbi:glycosyltransferase [Streptomyces sp. NPDC003753]|uniref:glycosyltransferase n=1 Tax=Streptomyces sp. Y2F8-2 TaxID=2759675 RepID=UPI001905F09D|nr:nucleotide disphospho-sugar-binding domain-containing protein [Streptomyces sp. Y2F8-2]GHK04170.1 glycosyl transferase [Streptomyces sp. Y2F8-2]